MKTAIIVGAVMGLVVSSTVLGANEQGKIEINKERKEGTVNQEWEIPRLCRGTGKV